MSGYFPTPVLFLLVESTLIETNKKLKKISFGRKFISCKSMFGILISALIQVHFDTVSPIQIYVYRKMWMYMLQRGSKFQRIEPPSE